jgi:hypothetical protein
MCGIEEAKTEAIYTCMVGTADLAPGSLNPRASQHLQPFIQPSPEFARNREYDQTTQHYLHNARTLECLRELGHAQTRAPPALGSPHCRFLPYLVSHGMLDKSHVSVVSALIGSPQSHDVTDERKGPKSSSGQSKGKGHRANSVKLVRIIFVARCRITSPLISLPGVASRL